MNKLKKIAILFLLVFFGALYGTPYLVVYNMQNATNDKDYSRLESYINFPVLKSNLKQSFTKRMTGEANKDNKDNPLAIFGSVVAGAVINPMVDNLVTPKSLAMLMNGRNSIKDNMNIEHHETVENKKIETKLSYRDFSHFVMTISNNKNNISFILSRENLFFWKLTDIKMPH